MTTNAEREDSERRRRAAAAPDPAAVPDVDVLVVDNYDSFAYNLVQYVGELAGDVTVRRNDEIDLADVRALDPDGVVVSPGPGRPADAGVSTALFEVPDLPILGVCLGHQALCAAYGAAVEQAPGVVHGKSSAVEHDGAGLYRSLPERLRVGRYHSLVVRRAALPDSLVETAWTVPEGSLDPGESAGSGGSDGPDGTVESGGSDESDRTDESDESDEPGESDGSDESGESAAVRAPNESRDDQSVLMGVRHRERPHYGVQFHPESILTGSPGDADAGSLAVGKRLVAHFCELAAERRQHRADGERRQCGADGERTPEGGSDA